VGQAKEAKQQVATIMVPAKLEAAIK